MVFVRTLATITAWHACKARTTAAGSGGSSVRLDRLVMTAPTAFTIRFHERARLSTPLDRALWKTYLSPRRRLTPIAASNCGRKRAVATVVTVNSIGRMARSFAVFLRTARTSRPRVPLPLPARRDLLQTGLPHCARRLTAMPPSARGCSLMVRAQPTPLPPCAPTVPSFASSARHGGADGGWQHVRCAPIRRLPEC